MGMTVPYLEIRETMIDRMSEFTGITPDRVDHSNATYAGGSFPVPVTGVWCAFYVQYATAVFSGMGETPTYRRPGQVIIQCFCRKGKGLREIMTLADGLCDHFQSWSTGHIECLEATQQVVGDFKDFYQINVTIRFRAG